VDTIYLYLHGLRHAITIMPHSRAREDTAQPSRLRTKSEYREYQEKDNKKAGENLLSDPVWRVNVHQLR
jgi:hypothetical protein